MVHGQPIAADALEPEAGSVHAQWAHDLALDVRLETIAGDLLDQTSGHRIAAVVVGHAGTRRPARGAGGGVDLQRIAQGAVVGPEGVLPQVKIVEAGGVLQEVDHPHRVAVLLWVLEPDLRRQVAQASFEVDSAILVESEEG